MPSLSSIPALTKFEKQICEFKAPMDVRAHFMAFVRRCQNENSAVVEQALNELVPYLGENEGFLHACVLNEQPDTVVSLLTRSLLDCCLKFKNSSRVIMGLSAKCLGLIGCLDPNRVETIKEKKDILVLSNFDRMEETSDFGLFFLQHVLVDAFLSASNTRAQGFLAYAMQSLLRLCNLNSIVPSRSREIEQDEKYQRWLALPEATRSALTPFLTSKYTVTIGAIDTSCSYPLFSPTLSHGEWLRTLVQDLIQKGEGDNFQLIFGVCSRIIRGQDISISSFLLPFTVLNLTLNGLEIQKHELQQELTKVLSHPLPEGNRRVRENIIFCSEVSN
jgi:serine/threonine-protein kinase ATR